MHVQKLLDVQQSIDKEQCLHQYAALGDGVALFKVLNNRLVKTMDTKCASSVLADACKPYTICQLTTQAQSSSTPVQRHLTLCSKPAALQNSKAICKHAQGTYSTDLHRKDIQGNWCSPSACSSLRVWVGG